jgi:hypothetical protein
MIAIELFVVVAVAPDIGIIGLEGIGLFDKVGIGKGVIGP